MESSNLFAGIPGALPEEFLQTLATGKGIRIERIVSRGHCSPPDFWYDQKEEEWVLLLQGEAILRFERNDRSLRLVPGDHVRIAAHERHRVDWTRDDIDTIWLAVFYPPVDG